MPRRESLSAPAIILLLACSLSLGCGIVSKRTSLEEAVEDLDAVEAEQTAAASDNGPHRESWKSPHAGLAADPQQGDIDLVSAESPLADHDGDATEDDLSLTGDVGPQRADTSTDHAIEQVTTENFESEVLDAESPVLVDFYAEWCGPCKKLAPILSGLAADTPGVKVVKVDIDKSAQLAKTYRVRSVPTLILFRQGEPVSEHRGMADRRTVETLVTR